MTDRELRLSRQLCNPITDQCCILIFGFQIDFVQIHSICPMDYFKSHSSNCYNCIDILQITKYSACSIAKPFAFSEIKYMHT